MILTEFDLAELIDDALLQEQEPVDIARAILAGGVKLPVAPKPSHKCTDFWDLTNDAYGDYRACVECGHQTNPKGGEL
ncbi:hypothetical protein ACFQ6H_21195 [Rhodococcus sp. NPDC056506]|uniref:hypothetical protein n=1 Tax=Rhodococcus sp. NPDC056506 TaxID=3345844 RepID=UPI00366C36D1